MAGRYKFLEELGTGGAGAVSKAYDTQLDRYVAIKRLFTKAEMEQSDSQSGGLRKEASSLAALQHPNIVSIYDLGSDDEGFFMVMELVEGETLADWISSGPMNLHDFQELGAQTLEAVLAAHSQSLLHRDLKPENIKVQRLPGGRIQVKVLDFGLARLSYGAKKMTEDQQGNIMGSIYYMSPEQFLRKPLDGRADLYALGCVYYQVLCGHRPFKDASVQGIMNMHLQHRVHPLKSLAPHLPTPLCDWVMWLINLEPDDRPANAQQALDSLREMIAAGWLVESPQQQEAIPVAIAVNPAATGPLRASGTQSLIRSPVGGASQKLTGNVPRRTTGLQPRKPTSGVPQAPLSGASTILTRKPLPVTTPDPDVYDPKSGIPKWVYPVGVAALFAIVWSVWPKSKTATPNAPGKTVSTGSAPVPAPPASFSPRPADFLLKGSVVQYRSGEGMVAYSEPGQAPSPAKSGSLVKIWSDLQESSGMGPLLAYDGLKQSCPTLLIEQPPGIKAPLELLRFDQSQAMAHRMDLADPRCKDYPFGEGTAKKGLTAIMLLRPAPAGREVRCIRFRNQDNRAHINVRAFPNNEWRLGVKVGETSKEAKVINRSTKALSLVGITWDATTNKAVLNIRSEDGKARVEMDAPKDGLAVLNEIRLGEFSTDPSKPVAVEDKFSGDIVELVVWPFAMGWEERSGQEMKFMQHYFVNPGSRY